jgi:uncharacterized protein YegJ (DUF2314 family)
MMEQEFQLVHLECALARPQEYTDDQGTLFVKVHFRDGDSVEGMWCTPTGPGTGKLDNVPVVVQGVQHGDDIAWTTDAAGIRWVHMESEW